MLPSCGCSQFSLIVGIGPMFSRSMCVASSSARWNFLSSVIAVQTSVGPIASSIFSCGHCTTVHEREHVFLLGDRRRPANRTG